MKIKVSDYISNFFVSKKMHYVFGITGGGAMHLNDSFGKNKKLNFVFFHHEQSASMAADAFYRKNQFPCVLHTTSGPGATNAITGVTGAWVDSIPMFIVSGQVATKDMIQNTKTRQIGVQEINITDIVKPITKFSATIKDPNKIDIYLNKCFNLMLDQKPGPVWLDVPLDVQSKFIDTNKIEKFKPKKIIFIKKKKINLRAVEKYINKSTKPIFVIGNGLHISKSEKLFNSFLNKTNIPVISSWNSSDIISSNNNLYVGRMGIFGDRASNFAIESSDLIIVLGSRLSVPQTGYKTKIFAQNAKKIIVDIDKKELEKNKLSNVVIKYEQDLNSFLQQANSFFKSKKLKKFNKWINLLNFWKKKYPVMKESYKKEKKGINSFHFIDSLSSSLKGKETVVTDMGTSFTCTMQGFKIKNPTKQRLFTSSGLAAMGFGLPGAIGAYFAGKKNNIVCVTGDGGLMFNIQELETVRNYKIPMKIFVLENKGYLTMKLMQKKNFKRLVGSNKKSGVSFPSFKSVAKAFGLKYFKLKQNSIENQIKQILKLKVPTLIEVNMPGEQPLIPRMQSKLLKDGSFFLPKLDDLFPHLKESDLRKERIKALNIA